MGISASAAAAIAAPSSSSNSNQLRPGDLADPRGTLIGFTVNWSLDSANKIAETNVFLNDFTRMFSLQKKDHYVIINRNAWNIDIILKTPSAETVYSYNYLIPGGYTLNSILLPDGESVFIAFRSSGDKHVKYCVFNVRTGTMTKQPTILLTETDGNYNSIHLAVLKNGNIAILLGNTALSNTDSRGTKYTVLDQEYNTVVDMMTLSSEFTASGSNCGGLTVLDNGKLLFIFSDYSDRLNDPNNYYGGRLKMVIINPSDGSLDTTVDIINSNDNSASMGVRVSKSNGTIAIMTQPYYNTSIPQLYIYDAFNHQVSQPVDITNKAVATSGSGIYFMLETMPDGNYIAIYSSNPGGGTYYKIFDTDGSVVQNEAQLNSAVSTCYVVSSLSGNVALFSRTDGLTYLKPQDMIINETTVNAIKEIPDTSAFSTPPTSAELTTAFGSPATVGAGFTKTINVGGLGNNNYRVVSDGTNWHVYSANKAV